MKISKYLILLFLLLSATIIAQDKNMKDKKEQIRTLKVAFLTTELNLTPQEAEKFWPIYNTFDDKQFDLRHRKMKAFKSKLNNDALSKMSDKDASTLLSQIESTDAELFNLRKKFNSNLKEILPAVKILKLKKSEEDFNRKLLQQYRDRGPKK